MVVSLLFLFLIIALGSGSSESDTLVTIKQSRTSDYHYYEAVKRRFREDFEHLDAKARECFAETFKLQMDIPEETLRLHCVGQYNEIIHFVYGKNMRRLRRAFAALVLTNLEPFRAKYEDEIVYFMQVLHFVIVRGMLIKDSVYAVLKTTKYQVHPRKFFDLVKILDELLNDFQELQNTIIAIKVGLLQFMARQISNRDKLLEELFERQAELENVNVDSHDIA